MKKSRNKTELVRKEVTYPFSVGEGQEMILLYQIYLFTNKEENNSFILNLN